ncbi:unnamed protein product [Caenorhabditis nigoni]
MIQIQEPVVLYKIRSIDRQRFLIDRPTVAMIGRLDEFFMNAGLDLIPADDLNAVQLEVSAPVLRKVIEWCDHHKFDPPHDEARAGTGDMSEWDANFFMVRHSVLFEIIRTARDYDIPGLFAMCCQIVGQNPEVVMAGLLDDDDDDGVGGVFRMRVQQNAPAA